MSAAPSRIMIVDDQEFNLQVLGGMLGKLGYEIVPATSGEQALRRMQAGIADLILLDVLMPGMDGFEVCRRIRGEERYSDIPIIFLSAADDKTFIVRALEAGAVDYVTKPFNQAELISRVRTHLALKNARDRLRQLAEDKDELVGILTHDLKNHLGGMQMSAQLMHDRALELKDNRLIRTSSNILHATDQMFAFVKEYLANAAADRGVTFNFEAVSLSDAVSAAVERYGESAKRKNLTIHASYSPDAPLVRADRVALDQVIDNLMSNAVKFSPAGKSIWASVKMTDDGRGEFLLRDEGPGCTAEDLAKMFTRYARLTARPTAGEPSTGLGLSIAKRHANAMEADLHCESSPGLGANFILRLPATTAA